MADSPLIDSLRKAVQAAPQDVPLRLHLAGLLLDSGSTAEAISHLGLVLSSDPGSAGALELMQRAVGGARTHADPHIVPQQPGPRETPAPAAAASAAPAPSVPPLATPPSAPPGLPGMPATPGMPGPLPQPHPQPQPQSQSQPHPQPQSPQQPQASSPSPSSSAPSPSSSAPSPVPPPSQPAGTPPPPTGLPPSASSSPARHDPDPDLDSFDWDAAARDLGEVLPPRFVDGEDGELTEPAYDLEAASVRLADVGGMQEVKKRLEAAFLAPMRNPDLRKLYGKSLKGGLLLYGPPGCGKTFLARAVAGELGASFFSVTLADVLDMYIGQSERNLVEIFQTARRNAPCVLFLDEIDALGLRRSHLRSNAMRGTVNQLLSELDGISQSNEGVFVLAATNAPWDVDVALRRPGRLDRTLLVLPPDQQAREAILRHHLKDRPVAKIDLGAAARRTDGYSGADLAHICDTAAERALMESAASGAVRMIEMRDLDAAIAEVKPSVGPWLESARNVAMYANEGGAYDELLAYLKKRKLL